MLQNDAYASCNITTSVSFPFSFNFLFYDVRISFRELLGWKRFNWEINSCHLLSSKLLSYLISNKHLFSLMEIWKLSCRSLIPLLCVLFPRTHRNMCPGKHSLSLQNFCEDGGSCMSIPYCSFSYIGLNFLPWAFPNHKW